MVGNRIAIEEVEGISLIGNERLSCITVYRWASSLWTRYRYRVLHFISLVSLSSPALPSGASESVTDLLGQFEFSDGVGALALVFTIVLAILGFVRWWFLAIRKRKDEASLVTSDYKFQTGLGLPSIYEFSVHNATPHPLSIVEVRYWNGSKWRPILALSSQTGDPVILPGDTGTATVPAMTADLKELNSYYFLRYTDSRNRVWNRRIKSPNFLSRGEVRRLRRFHGTI